VASGSTSMKILRTPDACFDRVPEFPYAPAYVDVTGLRIHYVDAGQGDVVLCLHGEPTWSFVYRKLVRALSPRHRVIAPDLAGFGRSDKPADLADHTLHLHVDVVAGFVEALDLRDVTVVVHDWGGLIGLAALPRIAPRVARLVIMNTGLPIGEEPVPEDFMKWRRHVEKTPDLPVGKAVRNGLAHAESVDAAVIAAYDAPFPDPSYKAGPRALPLLVPLRPEDAIVPDMRRARAFLGGWQKPALVLFSDRDPVTGGWEQFFRKLIPSARHSPPTIVRDAGHFLQEEKGEAVAAEIERFLSSLA
jgi:haloalkane dehalogenase